MAFLTGSYLQSSHLRWCYTEIMSDSLREFNSALCGSLGQNIDSVMEKQRSKVVK